ncbi:MAG TPA: hypothetical protein VHX16_01755 [Chloroflexota bacterium]|nr:hypothetical protein [Chloroflexota bacterium]
MSTILTTQKRANPLVLDARVESSGNIFSGIAEVIGEIGYCIKLSAQSLAFSMQEPAAPSYAPSSAARVNMWPVDLWVF